MFHCNVFLIAKSILLLLFISQAYFACVDCLNFNYTSFPNDVLSDFLQRGNSSIAVNALQVTFEAIGAESLANLSGRILYNKPFRVWSKKEGKVASFNTTFMINIKPAHEGQLGREGLAFILTEKPEIPDDSYGQWLGIVNQKKNGSSDNNIVAIEFDTKKSYPEDADSNHVGIDVNTVNSLEQISLNGSGIEILSGSDITAEINYDGANKTMNVSVVYRNNATNASSTVPIISMPLDLSLYLPELIYVGFSASTGTTAELNCVKSWQFTGTDLDLPTPWWYRYWVWVVVSLSIVVVVLLISGYVSWRVKKDRTEDEDDDDAAILELQVAGSTLGPKKYKLKELKSATGNFNSKNELGRGGFGIVYRGTFNDGEEVAVKRTEKNNQQGKKNMIAEISSIGSIHHKNLVKLIGWCIEKKELLLVYEYMPNGSLDQLLYPDDKKNQLPNWKVNIPITILSWEKRHSIICGVAQALDYLHNECTRRILHRDIKASNIMLDSDFNPCLGDFGLARMFKLSERTHHTTIQIAGTPGYMAPEIFHTGKASSETDVYAFGVLVLEVACGSKPGVQSADGQSSNSIVDFVWEYHRMDMIRAALDPRLDGQCDEEAAESMLLLGLACCHPNPYQRPSMRAALQVLMGEAPPPLVPFEKPAFVWPTTSSSLTNELNHSFSGGMLSSLGSSRDNAT